jgi:hypothetical protein
LTAELYEDGGEETTDILFSGVLEIKEEVRHVCRHCAGDAFDILNDRRAGVLVENISIPCRNNSYRVTYVSTLLPHPAIKIESLVVKSEDAGYGNIRFPWIHSTDPDSFQFLNALLSMNHSVVPL